MKKKYLLGHLTGKFRRAANLKRAQIISPGFQIMVMSTLCFARLSGWLVQRGGKDDSSWFTPFLQLGILQSREYCFPTSSIKA